MGSDFAALQREVVDFAFPGGTVRVDPHERWISHQAIQSGVLEAGVLHPVWILIAALKGMGISLEELIRLAGAEPSDGVLFGEAAVDQHAPLRVGVTYSVDGKVSSFKRRQGKRAGTFDLLTFRLALKDESGNAVATSTNSFVFPRSGAPDAG